MNPRRLQSELEGRLGTARVLPAGRTALAACAADALGMMDAYRKDGETFFIKGDRPNALACFAYALGWSDAASSLGLIATTRTGFPPCDAAQASTGPVDPRMAEKTGKYDRHLSAAIGHLAPAAEEGACLYTAAESFLLVARVFHDQGYRCQQCGRLDEALASYSYASGWLDAGVRTGLFRITGRRELFTI